MVRMLVCAGALLLAATCAYGRDAISSSSVELCTDYETDDKDNCQDKLIIAFTLGAEQAEEAAFSFGTSSSGESIDLQDPVSVSLEKSAVALRYSLTYMMDFNNRPYEIFLCR